MTRQSVSLYNSDYWSVTKVGCLVTVLASNVKTSSDSWALTDCPYVIEESLRPGRNHYADMTVENGGSHTRQLVAMSNGTIRVRNLGSTGSSDNSGGSLVYPIGL